MYLDDAGWAPPFPAAQAAAAQAPPGNPMSLHAEGRAARHALDHARDSAAATLGVDPREIVFCATGEEAATLAVIGASTRLWEGAKIVTWAAQAPAVAAAVLRLRRAGREALTLSLDATGAAVVDRLPEGTALVSVSAAGFETGTLQPLARIAAAAREAGALLHVDFGAAPRWSAPDLDGVDLASFSGDLCGAGRGGLLWVRPGVRLEPLVEGGAEEWGLRPGAVDVAGAAALAAALECCAAGRDERAAATGPLAARLGDVLADLGAEPLPPVPKLPNFAWATFESARGEDMLLALDAAGVAAAGGPPCAAGSLDPSPAALAMGRSLRSAFGALRLSAGPATTVAEIDAAVDRIREALAPLVARG